LGSRTVVQVLTLLLTVVSSLKDHSFHTGSDH